MVKSSKSNDGQDAEAERSDGKARNARFPVRLPIKISAKTLGISGSLKLTYSDHNYKYHISIGQTTVNFEA